MKAICRFLSLAEVSRLDRLPIYQEMVRPLDYEFGLVRNGYYVIIGVTTREGTPWFFAIEENENIFFMPTLIPVVLFDYEPKHIPSDWIFRLVGETKEDIEIIPKELADFPDWYGHLAEEDEREEEVMEVVLKLFNEAKQK